MTFRTSEEIVSTLRSEVRWRPTIWGDARPLLVEAADRIEILTSALSAAAKTLERSAEDFAFWHDKSRAKECEATLAHIRRVMSAT